MYKKVYFNKTKLTHIMSSNYSIVTTAMAVSVEEASIWILPAALSDASTTRCLSDAVRGMIKAIFRYVSIIELDIAGHVKL